MQQKENVNVRIVTEKGSLLTQVSELKYSGNKFGKKLFDENELGRGFFIDIDPSIEEETMIVKPKAVKKPQEKIETIELKEEIIIKDQQKIRLSRLDLFDEDDE